MLCEQTRALLRLRVKADRDYWTAIDPRSKPAEITYGHRSEITANGANGVVHSRCLPSFDTCDGRAL